MYNRSGNNDKELDFREPYGKSEESPIIQPLRIHKPRDSISQHLGNPSVTSRTCCYENNLPYPDKRDEDDYAELYEPRTYRTSDLLNSLPNSRDSSQTRNSMLELSSRSESVAGEKNMTPKMKYDSEETEGAYANVRRKPAPRPISELQGSCVFTSKQDELKPSPTSNYIPYLEPRRFQDYQKIPPQELDGSLLVNNNSKTIPSTNGMNRLNSTASFSTTRASRGSPPPDSPLVSSDFGPNKFEVKSTTEKVLKIGNLAKTYPYTESNVQKNYLQRSGMVSNLSQSPEMHNGDSNNSRLRGLNHDNQGVNKPTKSSSPSAKCSSTQVLRQGIQQLHLSPSPPPSYSSVHNGKTENIQVASNEKRRVNNMAAHSISHQVISIPYASSEPQYSEHSTIKNEPEKDSLSLRQDNQVVMPHQYSNLSSIQGQSSKSPPLLPEGWISHIDPKSGQYYYIHLATQSTQWEFPMGPAPLNYNTMPVSLELSSNRTSYLSPTSSTFGSIPLASPGFSSSSVGYNDSIIAIASQTPTITGFTGPPPSSGVNVYKITPTNGVYFGPYLRYTNMNIHSGIWFGSIMIVTDTPQSPTIHIHQSVDLSPDPRQLKPELIFTHQRWTFYRYNLDLQMGDESSQKWTYAVTSHLGCTRYEFLVAGRYETKWKFIAHSGNGFAVNTSISERSKLGGTGVMWQDILQKHSECGGFHVQLGLGDQIYGDRIWKEIPLLKQWLATSGKENRKNVPWTARHEEDVSHAYFHYYTSHLDQDYIREAFAQIPHILQINHHDIFDGFGSYPDYLQTSNIFENIGRIGIRMYLLFQHHTTLDVLRRSCSETDIFTITGTGWHFIKFLGPALTVVGPDCRSERNQRQVLSGPSYQGLFPKIATLPSSVQHCIWMISVPIIYPRLDTVESIAHTFTTAKKGVTGTYNLLGKVTSSVAGVVGGKQAVASGFSQVKKVVGKSGLMGNVLNTFGDFDIADELRDMWTHESKDLERTYLIRTLQGIARQKGIRMTFLSGDVNCSGAGLVHDPSHPSNHKTMYQIISSPVVAAPLPYYVLRMLHNHKVLYVPPSGQRTSNAVSDTKEDMMEIFQTDTNNTMREMKKLMGRRNYVIFVTFDPEAITTVNHSVNSTVEGQQQQTSSKLSLAVDFIVQNEGSSAISKYGPVIIPNLELGR